MVQSPLRKPLHLQLKTAEEMIELREEKVMERAEEEAHQTMPMSSTYPLVSLL